MMSNKTISDTVVDSINFYENRIKLTIVAGDKLLYSQVLPIKD